jgi:hypothetical protein
MEAVRSSEMSANLYKATRCQIPEDGTFPLIREFEIKLPSRIFEGNRKCNGRMEKNGQQSFRGLHCVASQERILSGIDGVLSQIGEQNIWS